MDNPQVDERPFKHTLSRDPIQDVVDAIRKIAAEEAQQVPPLNMAQRDAAFELLKRRWGNISLLVSDTPQAAQAEALSILVKLIVRGKVD